MKKYACEICLKKWSKKNVENSETAQQYTHPKYQDSTSIRKSSKIGGTDLWERDD